MPKFRCGYVRIACDMHVPVMISVINVLLIRLFTPTPQSHTNSYTRTGQYIALTSRQFIPRNVVSLSAPTVHPVICSNVKIDGEGIIDGGGQLWWEIWAAKQAGNAGAVAFLTKDRSAT